MNDSITNNEILPIDFVIYRKDRVSRGGGVMMAVHFSISSKPISSPDTLELIVVEMKQISCTVCTVYVPPNSDLEYMSSLVSFLSTLSSSTNLIVMGDFNSPDINWAMLCGSSPSSNALCEFVFSNGLVQLVTEATHIKGNTLDLVLTNIPDVFMNVSVNSINHIINTDHLLISFTLKNYSVSLSSSQKKSHYIMDYNNMDLDGLCDYLLDFDFSSILALRDVEETWSSLKSVLTTALDLFVPKKKVPSKKSPVWFNSSIRHHLNRVHTLRRKVKSVHSDNNCKKLVAEEQLLKDLMQKSRDEYEYNLVHSYAKNKDNKIYKYVNSLLKRSSLPSTMYLGDLSASSDSEKAALFNGFFESVYHKQSDLTSFDNVHIDTTNTLSEINITYHDVYSALVDLDPNKAMGIDAIGPKILKYCVLALYIPIHHLFNLCLSHTCIPAEWKVHRIVPIFKSGDRSHISNYRPISLLCTISKVLETIIYDKVIIFLYGSISVNQFGFLQGHSCLQQILSFLNNVYNNYDNKTQTDVLYLDFRKAFDSVSHSHLLCKLKMMGITGSLWNWFEAYLSTRQQCVAIGNQLSDLLPVSSGVPQGSILGPLLFLIYINDIPSVVNYSSLFLFADDTKCCRSISRNPDSSLLQKDLSALCTWCSNWNLTFNDSKCTLLSIRGKNFSTTSATYVIDDKPVKSVNFQKDLGIVLTSDLSWNEHYSHISAKAYKSLGLIKRIFGNNKQVSVRKCLYLTLVRSQLGYSSVIWRPRFIKDIIALERIQRRATKFVLSDYHSDYKTRLIKLKLLPLMAWFEYIDIMFFITSLHHRSDRFDILRYVTITSHCTRSSDKVTLQHTFSRSCLSHHFYFNRLPRLWNALPFIDINNPINSIRRVVKRILWSNFLNNFKSDDPCSYHYCCPCNKCV